MFITWPGAFLIVGVSACIAAVWRAYVEASVYDHGGEDEE